MSSSPSPVPKEKEKEKKMITSESPLDSENFINQEDILDFKCAICNYIPNPTNIVEATCCGHVFCYDCLKEYLKKEGNCPLCQKKINLSEKSKIIGKFMRQFEIKCPYKCEWEGTWENLDKHFTECKNVILKCKYEKKLECKFIGNEEELKEHEKDYKAHLDLAVRHCNMKENRIMFDLGESYMTKVHNHPLIFKTSRNWFCDGKNLPGGCIGPGKNYDYPARFRCSNCDFDLCTYCIMKYVIHK